MTNKLKFWQRLSAGSKVLAHRAYAAYETRTGRIRDGKSWFVRFYEALGTELSPGLRKSSARVAQGLRKSVRFAATILVLLWIGVGNVWGATYELYSGTITEGDYIIVYDGKAMKNSISSSRWTYESVTISSNKITNPTNEAKIVWHIAASGDYWTIYSNDASQYAVGTGSKNQGGMSASPTSNGEKWTVTGTSTYEFVNKRNADASVNKNLRGNGTNGFACYSTQTGGALSLYKKQSSTPTTIILSEAGSETTVSGTHYVGEEYTLPTTTDASCGTKVLVGWSTVTVSATDTKPASNFYAKGATVTLGATNKFYAVFANVTSSSSTTTAFSKYSGALTTGDYVFTYGLYVMGNTISSNRCANGTFPTIVNDVISGTPAGSIVWTIGTSVVSGTTYYTLYNASTSKYLAKTSKNNQASLVTSVDDGARYSCSSNANSTTYDFVNKGNSRYLRNNTTNGWAMYSSSTGGALTLYKKGTVTTTVYDTTAYATTCCTALGSIKGSISWTHPNEAVLSWNDMSHVDETTPYTVTYRTGSDAFGSANVGSITTSAGKKTCTITGLSCNTTYDFKIAVTAASGYCGKDSIMANKNSGLWSVAYSLTGVTTSAGANVCGDYTAVFAPSSIAYALPSDVTVQIGGVTKTKDTDYTWNSSTGTLSIASAKITGNLSITVTGVEVGCSADPTIGAASLSGAFGLSSVGVTVSTSSTGSAYCAWTDYGFVWGTSANPTVSDNKVQIGNSDAATTWSGNLTGSFSTGTTYYFRAYGTNSKTGAVPVYGIGSSFTPRSVTFESNGGSAVSTVYVNSGSTVSEPSAPTRTGYDFVKWQLNGADYSFSSPVNANITLDAVWTKHNYTISSTLTHVTSSPAIPDSYEYTGSAAGLSYTLTAAAGYSLPESVTVSGTTYTWDQATGTLTLTGTIASDVSITVVALPTVTWIANGSVFATQSGAAGTSLTNPGTPSNSTYCDGVKVFVGWTETEIVGETDTEPADLFTSAEATSKTIPAGGKTYYAVFATESSSTSTATFNPSTQAGLTNSDRTWTHTASGITLQLVGNADYTKRTDTHWQIGYTNGNATAHYATITSPTNITNIQITLTGSEYKVNSVTNGTLTTDGTSQTITGSFKTTTLYPYVASSNSKQARMSSIDVTYKPYSAYATTCSTDPRLSVEPTELDFGDVANGTYKELTFSLTGSYLTANASIGVSGTNSSYFTVSPSSVNKGSGTISATDITVRYTPGAVGDGHTATVTVTSGEAEEKTVTLTGNSKATYSVSVSPTPSNGTVTADKTSGIMAGETVTLTITPISGYQLASINAVDGSSNTVTLSGNGNTRTFTMPAGNVTIAATFAVRTDYVLVESALDDYSGEYLIVANNANTEGMYALSGRYGNKDAATYGTFTNVYEYYESGAKTIESNSTTDAMKMVIEAGSTPGYYTIKFEADNTYLGMLGTNTSTGDKLRFLSSPIGNTYVYEWSISLISETTRHRISIWNTAATPAKFDLQRNGTYGYRLYSSTLQDPELYKKTETCERLAAPTGLSAGSLTQTTATLSWTAVANASGYEVSLDNGSSWTSAGTNTSYSATSLTQGTTYNWKVRATGDESTYCAKGSAASSSFTTKRAVKVTYTTNGATGGTLPVSGGVVNLTEGDSHTVLDNTGSGGSPTPLTKTGYTWAGWHSSTTYNATPAYTVGGTITVTENITLYANWMPKRDTFIDGVHGTADQYGDGANYTVPSCSDQSRATSGDCEQKHYKFIGWALIDADLTNPANIISAGGTRTATGATYYAVWGEEL